MGQLKCAIQLKYIAVVILPYNYCTLYCHSAGINFNLLNMVSTIVSPPQTSQ